MPPITLLIKPASGNCNLRCNYCFYYDETQKREQASYGFMSEETLEQVLKQALSFAEGSCTVAFQGGEPTLCGLPFFESVLRLEEKYNVNHVQIDNAIQTNGYRLDEKWAGFLAKNHFLTGVSLDGSKDTHNAYRKNIQGEDTFFDVMKTLNMLGEYGVEYNILTVVHNRTARKPRKIYEFFKKQHYGYLQFIPCLDPLGEESGGHEYSLTPEAYGTFLNEIFDLWYEDLKKGEQPFIRQFENYIALLIGQAPEACDQRGVCNYQYVVEADGEVYPCDFYVLDEYKLGNLNQVSFAEIDEKRHEIGFMEYSLTDHEKCKECRYYGICRGGCRRHRIFDDGSGHHVNQFCISYQMFFEHTLNRMISIAEMLKRQ